MHTISSIHTWPLVLFSIFHYSTHFTPEVVYWINLPTLWRRPFSLLEPTQKLPAKSEMSVSDSLFVAERISARTKMFSQFVVTFPAPFPKLIPLFTKIQSGTPQGKSLAFYGPIVKPQSWKYCIRCGNWVLTRQDHPREYTSSEQDVSKPIVGLPQGKIY